MENSLFEEKTSSPCDKCGSNKYGIQWGCMGCSNYWICMSCVYGMSPTNLVAPTLTKLIEDELEKSLDAEGEKPIEERSVWKILCPQCTEFMIKRRETSEINEVSLKSLFNEDSSSEADDNEEKVTNTLETKIMELTNIVNNFDVQLKEIKVSLSNPIQKSYAEVTRNSDIDNISSVVQNSVKNAIIADELEKDIIVSHLPEECSIGKDLIQVQDLCDIIGLNPNCISEVNRLGSSAKSYNRLLKVRFKTKFDARIFCSNYEFNRRNNEKLKNCRIRPMLTNEDNKVRRENSNLVYNWNKESLTKGVSYSLRFDGSIWCFRKQSDGRWLRDISWKIKDNVN